MDSRQLTLAVGWFPVEIYFRGHSCQNLYVGLAMSYARGRSSLKDIWRPGSFDSDWCSLCVANGKILREGELQFSPPGHALVTFAMFCLMLS